MSFAWEQSRWKAALIIGLACGALALCAATNETPFKPKLPNADLFPQGQFVYQRNCLVCHGVDGDGLGEMGRQIKPRPRDFTDGIFKYRSTPAGALPTDADLERTIRGGLPGTAMPIFNQLSDKDVRSVAEYVKIFSPRWRNPTNYAPPLQLPALPGWFDDEAMAKTRAQQGRALFASACAACHGADGGGNGPAAPGLEDSWGQPVLLSDLRRAGLRNGRDPAAIYRVLLTGIDGTPMPSFAESTTDDERWNIVAFIAQLRASQINSN